MYMSIVVGFAPKLDTCCNEADRPTVTHVASKSRDFIEGCIVGQRVGSDNLRMTRNLCESVDTNFDFWALVFILLKKPNTRGLKVG